MPEFRRKQALAYPVAGLVALVVMALATEGAIATDSPAQLASQSDIIISCVSDTPDVEQIILGDHHFWGGLRASVELARICRTFGRGMSMHSNSHLGISLAAMAHLAAAVPNLTYACDTHYPWQCEDVIAGPAV